ncbi:MAG: tRNA preQ1(34) S-adenosylmethionine ribosyltransferase-isomerase QueA [Planctomycetota bacterium]|nr:tRNA preQ1(34) S-adenosylmethionine ribosyltransferase-isomerase QueA [Planctomycetota bacterium]
MRASDFDYVLPESAIAQVPAEPRDSARLMVHDVARDATEHRFVRDLPTLLTPGDLLIVNDTRVRPARLFGKRASGGQVELLLTARVGNLWRAMVRPAKKLEPGQVVELEDGAVTARAVTRVVDADGGVGAEWTFELAHDARFASIDAALEAVGHMPLPPYIRRARAHDERAADDRSRYQTVFAREPGAVAAPTAGLHFTPELMRNLASADIQVASVTLHVGLGTFQPMQTDVLAEHRMHAEDYVLPEATVAAIERARERGRRVIAVGTTSARVLESCADESGRLTAGSGSTRLFITPGRPFRAIDGLLTNFHLPKSTLLVLVSTLAGRERVLRLYAEALEQNYRFYSYGDAQLYL